MSSTGNQPSAVVVDAYSAGNYFPAALATLGLRRLIHVQSTPDFIPTMAPPRLTDYAENIICTDEAAVVERLREHSAVCVIPGQESAVRLADRLSEALGVPSNGSALSRARRDKYEMIETLRRAGIRCARQFKSADPAALVEWADRGGTYPVVVKPVDSAGTDNVYICHGPEEVMAAARCIRACRNLFGIPNTEALIQSYLAGTEYIVDTVSCDGHRYACGVWEYEKSLLPIGQRIYDRDILVDPDNAPVPELVSYVDEVLDALNIRWGPAHAEVIMTAEGPALVEIAARLNGNIDPGTHDVCLGTNQVALSALAYVRPEEFLTQFGDRVYRRLQLAVVYNTPTVLDGQVDSVDQAVVDKIRALESVHQVVVKLKPGSRIRPTVDLMSSTMRIYLTAASQAQLMADYTESSRLKDSVYRVTPT
jgi:biotin carboxylase